MTIREIFENKEKEFLSRHASLSSFSKGRAVYEPECEIRTCYQRDRDRIIHCKSFRRLKYKTQVFFNPEGDHYRDRLTHTLEVSQISRTIAKALFLNEELTEAIALGHDLGHTPFGHAGEKVLDEITREKLGEKSRFLHNEQSIRVVTEIEKNGKGLNLTYEVLDGIKNHSEEYMPATLEGKTVRLSDKIAYINHDIDDALRAGIFSENDLPEEEISILGRSHRERINTIVLDIVRRSADREDIELSPEISRSLFSLRDFLFKNLYLRSPVKIEEHKTEKILRELFEYYVENFDSFAKDYNLKNNINFSNAELYENIDFRTRIILIRDYISNMTDRFALNKFTEIFIPEKWEIIR
ncbi:MAG TPA: deoxyguanosinetriphosphate triphosphohydrolase [Actinobacteria bacterium]|jgi:dGTPase|nr:deoxyguanosinetriphosphate triphosphohydrolase [Actinomycetota bacterium]